MSAQGRVAGENRGTPERLRLRGATRQVLALTNKQHHIMGRVKVLYFAGVKALAGCGEDNLELQDLRLETVLAEVKRLRPNLAALIEEMKAGRSSTVLAIDQVFHPSLSDCRLQPNSEVAFIAPISGG